MTDMDKKYSAESGNASFETLFDDFFIEAFPYYNFWTEDESVNDKDELGNRDLNNVPRFIKVAWNITPDIVDNDRLLDVSKRNIKPVIFSRELERKNVFYNKGISFSPKHLQTDGFLSIKHVTANGYISPGTLNARVELPLSSIGFNQKDKIDEDAFLTNQEFEGTSINELKSQLRQLDSGVARSVYNSYKDNFDVTNNTLLRKSSRGMMKVTNVDPSSLPMSLYIRTANSINNNDFIEKIKSSLLVSKKSVNVPSIKVNFIEPVLDGLLEEERLNNVRSPEHIESLFSIVPYMSGLEILSRMELRDTYRCNSIPSIPSPKMKQLEYIGYVIEKYRQISGVFVKVEEIDIPNREIGFYIDTKVLYGEIYRYRIKTILRWTRENDKKIEENDPTIKSNIITQNSSVSPYKSSYFHSAWSSNWAYGACIDDQPPIHPDELTVVPESPNKRVMITFKFPDDPQKDILKMRLLRKFQNANGRDMSDWMIIKKSDGSGDDLYFPPQNSIYFDYDVDFFQDTGLKIVYAAQCISKHNEYSTLSEQLAVRLNKKSFSQGEFPVEFVSSPGVRMEYFGAFSTSPHKITKSEIVLTSKDSKFKLIISGRNTIGNMLINEKNYIVRVQSLDTGEEIDIPFKTTFNNISSRFVTSEQNFYITEDLAFASDNKEYEIERINRELKKYQDSLILKAENDVVHVYDRAMPNERW